MAEVNKEKSAARLASLQKVAAADRSAKRLETLKKCAERNLVKVSEDRSTLRRMALMKSAGVADTIIGSAKVPYDPGVLPKLIANEDLRRALVGAATTGTAAAVTSDRKNRWRNALLAAAAGGAGTYGLSATGALDNFFSPYKDINAVAKPFLRDQAAREVTRALRGPEKGSFAEQVRSYIENAQHKTHSVGIRV